MLPQLLFKQMLQAYLLSEKLNLFLFALQSWCASITEAMAKIRLEDDSHSPDKFRSVGLQITYRMTQKDLEMFHKALGILTVE